MLRSDAYHLVPTSRVRRHTDDQVTVFSIPIVNVMCPAWCDGEGDRHGIFSNLNSDYEARTTMFVLDNIVNVMSWHAGLVQSHSESDLY